MFRYLMYTVYIHSILRVCVCACVLVCVSVPQAYGINYHYDDQIILILFSLFKGCKRYWKLWQWW